VPAKLYEYLALGKPVLALTTSDEIAGLIVQTVGGWIADPESVESISHALEECWGGWRKRRLTSHGNSGLINAFERPTLTAELAALLHDVLSPGDRLK
jgi:hypothetical protein